MNEAMENNQTQVCPQCDNHCPVDALQCGRGRKYFGVAEVGHEHGHNHGGCYGHGHHDHNGEKHHHKHEGRSK